MNAFMDVTYHPDSTFVVRIAGLPVSVIDELSCAATEDRLQEAMRLSEWLRVEGAALSEALYPVIGQLTEPALKRYLVALRRAVFQGRPPDVLLAKVADAVPTDLSARIERWSRERVRRQHLVGQLPETLAQEIADKLPTVRELAAQPELRRGLAISSPSLLASLSSWLATEPSRLPRRRVLSSLIRYVGRMAMKTSPLSTFTLSGLGRWDNIGRPVRIHPPTRPQSHVAPPISIATAIISQLARRPNITGDLHIRLNPSLATEGGLLRFLVDRPDASIVTVRCTDAIRQCLAVVGTHEGTVAELREALATEPNGDVLIGLANQLSEVGVLEHYIPVPDQTPDLFAELVTWMETATTSRQDADAAKALSRLRNLHELAGRYAATDDATPRLALLEQFQSELKELTIDSGLRSQTDEIADRDVLHENVQLPDTPAICEPQHWEPLFDDLNAVVTLLTPFDPGLPLRLTLAHYVRQRWPQGSSVSFVNLYHRLHADSKAGVALAKEILRSAESSGDHIDSIVPEMRELRELRTRMKGKFSARRHISPKEVFDQATSWPAYLSPPHSIAVYGHLVRGEEPLLVLNSVGSGHGRGRSRLLRLLGQTPSGQSPGGQVPGVIFAEFDDLFGTNLNARVSELPFGIDFPGHVSHRPPHQRIPMGELVVVDEPETGTARLHWPRGGVEVRPVHTGMTAEIVLPHPVRLLINGFGETGYLLHPQRLLFGGKPPAIGSDVEAVVAIPRLQIGRVVVRRARWTARRAALPEQRHGEDDSLWMLRLLEWLRRHGIPRRCFVQVKPTDQQKKPRTPYHKPLFVDFSNWFLLVAFERMLGEPNQVITFSELLPVPEDAPRACDGVGRVVEYLFHLSGVSGRLGPRFVRDQ